MTQIRNYHPATPRLAAACARPIDHMLDPELFKALCDPTRLKLLACLAKCGRPCSVGEVAGCCAADLSVVSRHLSMLNRAGILKAEKKSRMVFYRVDGRWLCQALRSLADAFEECCPAVPKRNRRTCRGKC